MYGLVNQAIKQMVLSELGEPVWCAICSGVGIQYEDFDALRSYPDSLTHDLISAVSEKTNIPADTLLRRFGHYWLFHTAKYGYGEVLDLFGHDLRTCLKNLNRMHEHMGAIMPQLQPPRFTVTEDSPTKITLHYYSTRQGLAPMVYGLLEALSKKFDQPVRIEHIPLGTRSNHDEFELHFEAA